jgi:hypothetical protein
MAQRTLQIAILLLTILRVTAEADTPAASPSHSSFRPTWTIVGASAGFGLGLWAGLTAFDDATNSDRKVWTASIVSAVAGGVIGYFVDRHRVRPSGGPSASLPAWSPDLSGAPRLGTGAFKRWVEGRLPLASLDHTNLPGGGRVSRCSDSGRVSGARAALE